MTTGTEPHSGAYMGPQRDLFWNLDHIDLIGRRLTLARVNSVLDVGCGQGHWGRLLDRVTSPQATTVGVDMEPEWVAEAARQAQDAGISNRFSYEQGSADALRFEDGTFDLVTCQTVLIHVPNPDAVIAEMIRVTKPGGLVVAAEPNNRAGMLVELAPTDDYASDRPGERLQFYLTCARGKAALGRGNESIGDRLPGYFAHAGLGSIQVWLADRAWPLVPPYETEEQRTVRSLLLEEARNETWLSWRKDEARALFLAGGGNAAAFEAGWEARAREVRSVAAALECQTLHSAGGSIHYVIAGKRPS